MLVLLLAACREPAPPVPAPMASTPVADAPATSDFAVLSVTGEASDGRPALSVRFSQPLAEAQDLSQYLKVTDSNGKSVDGAWVTTDGGRQARFPHVKAEEKFKVEILAGVVAADGRHLLPG